MEEFEFACCGSDIAGPEEAADDPEAEDLADGGDETLGHGQEDQTRVQGQLGIGR